MSPRFAVLITFRALESYGAISVNASSSTWEGAFHETNWRHYRDGYLRNPLVLRRESDHCKNFTTTIKDYAIIFIRRYASSHGKFY